MSAGTVASQFRDWLTVAAILLGGAWAIWRFAHSEWLRRRSEIPSLDGSASAPDLVSISPDSVLVSLEWVWRNPGTRPLHLNTDKSRVDFYRLPPEIAGIIDPRQQKQELQGLLVVTHHPLADLDYMFEPGTNSTILTVAVLPANQTFLARMVVESDIAKHKTDDGRPYFWERWRVFKTELNPASTSGSG